MGGAPRPRNKAKEQSARDEEVERAAEKLGSPTAERDTLPLEGE